MKKMLLIFLVCCVPLAATTDTRSDDIETGYEDTQQRDDSFSDRKPEVIVGMPG